MESKLSLHRYDIVEAEVKIQLPSGHVQKKKRPYVIVGNEQGTKTSPTVIAMPLTHVIKKTHMPVHGCIEADDGNGLSLYSMVLGEQVQTLDKKLEIIRRMGSIVDQKQKDMINKICWMTWFYGEEINWKDVFACS